MKVTRKKRTYWYRFYHGNCPVCGTNHGYRERVYGRRPKSIQKRHIELTDFETFDHCI
jgi:hypothetical protein